MKTEDEKMIVDELLSVSRDSKIHIRTIGKTLVEYQLNNLENIRQISNLLTEKGIIIIIKG